MPFILAAAKYRLVFPGSCRILQTVGAYAFLGVTSYGLLSSLAWGDLGGRVRDRIGGREKL